MAKPNNGKPFIKNDPRINRAGAPKRAAGYKQYQASLAAWLLDDTVSDKDDRKFLEVVIEKYKADVLKTDRPSIRETFVDKVLFNEKMLEQLDDIIAHQKTTDINYLRYLIHLHLFDEQREVLLSKRKQKMLICGRRAGKTETLAAEIADCAISHDKGEILYYGQTAQRGYEIIWPRLIELLDTLHVSYKAKIAPSPTIEFASGVKFYIRGFASKDELGKARGDGYLLAIVDEVQEAKDSNLKYLLNEVLGPGLMQYKGTLILSGTPPRVAGSYVEKQWLDEKLAISRYHWTITQNPMIEDSETALARIREEHNLSENDPIYRREYLGEIGVYDLDALVYRLEKPKNYYDDKMLWDWVQSQPRTDIWVTGGLDFGYSDSDAFCLIVYSRSCSQKFIVYEYKKNKELLSELATAIKTGLDFVHSMPQLVQLVNKDIKIWGDSADPRSLTDLRTSYKLPVAAVRTKSNKDMSIARLQDEVKAGNLKIREGSLFEDEAKQIIFMRDADDHITRNIDEAYYHGDMSDAMLYSLRHYWDTTLGVNVKK